MRTLALRKASYIASQFPAAIVIGADSMVVLDDQLIGKPTDAADAVRILQLLRGRDHQVMTGVAIVCHQLQLADSFTETSTVSMRNYSGQEIADYVATGEPLDKAGAYGIFTKGGSLVEKVIGSKNTVSGLPIEEVKQRLEKLLLI